MKMYFICRSHKKIFSVGEAEAKSDQILRHHHVSTEQLLLAVTRFIYSHVGCDAGWIPEHQLYNMDLHGYRRAEEDVGIPFKGPKYMTVDESMETRNEDGERQLPDA